MFIVRCFSGLGQNESEYIDIDLLTWESDFLAITPSAKDSLSESLRRAGFANTTAGKQKLLPCSVGTFVDSSVTDPSELKCLECPAGRFFKFTSQCL